jgi:hypothetical protein
VVAALSFLTRPVFFRDAIVVMVLVMSLVESAISNSIEVLTPVWLLALFVGIKPASAAVGDQRGRAISGARPGGPQEIASGAR